MRIKTNESFESEYNTIPKIADIKKEMLLGNTAKHIIENGLVKSDIEANPSRYKVLSLSDNAAQDLTGAKIYEKDTKAYYGDSTANGGDIVMPKTFSPEANSRYAEKSIYSLDQKPYYGTGQDYKVLSNTPNDKVSVSVEIKELTDTYADEKNIKTLENNLQKLTEKESLNSVSLSGKYIKDSAPYYDPSADEKNLKASQISQTIENMKSEINENKKLQGPVFTEENFSVKTKIQNYGNLNREATNDFIANSYYYDAKGRQATPKTTLFNIGDEAEARKHNLVEVEALADNLGSKYVENTRKLTEAEEKDVSNIKNVEPHVVQNLKVVSNKKNLEKNVKPISKSKSNLQKNKKETVTAKKTEKLVEKIQAPKKEKIAAPKIEAPKVEAKKEKTAAPKIEAPKKEKIAATKIEAPKVEAKKEKIAAPKIEAPKVQEPKKEKMTTPKVEAPKVQEPKKEKMITPKIVEPKVHETKMEKMITPKIEAPKVQEPKKEKMITPKIEAPKVQEPKKEKMITPKIEAPKAEEPKKEKKVSPKVEVAKSEEPKKVSTETEIKTKNFRVVKEGINFDGFKTIYAKLPKEGDYKQA